MNKLDINLVSFKYELLEQAVKKSLKAGFKVIVFQSKEISQVFIESKQGICTIHCSLMSVNISSVHKPNRQTGTAFNLGKDLTNISLADIISACMTVAPYWAVSSVSSVKKWKDIEEMTSSCSLKYSELKDYSLLARCIANSYSF